MLKLAKMNGFVTSANVSLNGIQKHEEQYPEAIEYSKFPREQ